jgi:hypothetical protein
MPLLAVFVSFYALIRIATKPIKTINFLKSLMNISSHLIRRLALATASLAMLTTGTIAHAACTTNVDSRYSVNADGTVLDKTTSNLWKQCSQGQTGATCSGGAATRMTGDAAKTYAETFATLSGWAVPDRAQLESLVDTSCGTPTINQTVFPGTLSSRQSI